MAEQARQYRAMDKRGVVEEAKCKDSTKLVEVVQEM